MSELHTNKLYTNQLHTSQVTSSKCLPVGMATRPCMHLLFYIEHAHTSLCSSEDQWFPLQRVLVAYVTDTAVTAEVLAYKPGWSTLHHFWICVSHTGEQYSIPDSPTPSVRQWLLAKNCHQRSTTSEPVASRWHISIACRRQPTVGWPPSTCNRGVCMWSGAHIRRTIITDMHWVNNNKLPSSHRLHYRI